MAYVVFMSYSKFLIGVKYHNWRQTLDFYLLFAILLANLLKPKLQACNLQTGQSISYKYVNQFGLNLPHPISKK